MVDAVGENGLRIVAEEIECQVDVVEYKPALEWRVLTRTG
jgi:hypothetical protein